jgi:exodeoxyribonuclease VII large subunit
VDELTVSLHASIKNYIYRVSQGLRQGVLQLEYGNPLRRVINRRERLHLLVEKKIYLIKSYMTEFRQEVNQAIVQLDALSPLKVMQRGYSVVYREVDHEIVTRKSDVKVHDAIWVRLSDGKLKCQVLEDEI